LGVSRKTLSAVLNGKAGISPEMAIRLSIAFDTSAWVGIVMAPGCETGMMYWLMEGQLLFLLRFETLVMFL